MELLEPNSNIYYGDNSELYNVMEGNVIDYITPWQQHQYRQDGYITQPRYYDCENITSDGYFNAGQGGYTPYDWNGYHPMTDDESYIKITTRHTGPEYRKHYHEDGTEKTEDEIKKESAPADDEDEWTNGVPLYQQNQTAIVTQRDILAAADLQVMTSAEIDEWLSKTQLFIGDWWMTRKSYAEKLRDRKETEENEAKAKKLSRVHWFVDDLTKDMPMDSDLRKMYATMVKNVIERWERDKSDMELEMQDKHSKQLKKRQYYIYS